MTVFTKSSLLTAVCLTGVLLAASITKTTAQANDECTGAISLTPSTTCNAISGNLAAATSSSNNESDCLYDNEGDVWYKVTATSTDLLTIKVSNFASTDANLLDAYTALSVFTGDCNGLAEVNCSDYGEYYDGDSYDMSILINNATPGTTYYIAVTKQDTYDQDFDSYTPTDLSFDVCVQSQPAAPPPANNECANAVSITPGTTCNPVSGQLSGATSSQNGESDCEYTNNGDVWYTFTANNTSNLQVSLSNLSTTDNNTDEFDVAYSVFSGDCTNPIAEGCNNADYYEGESESSGSVSVGNVSQGNIYFVKVTNTGAYDMVGDNYIPTDMTFDICVQEVESLINDECSGAIAIGDSYSGDNTGATRSMDPIHCENWTSDAANDVWYKFTTATEGTAQVSVSQDDMDIVAEAFSGSCGSLQSIACVDEQPSMSFDAAANTTYYLRVYGYGGDEGTFDISISGVTLPLKLISFDGKTINGVNMLSWQTVEEKNFSHFEIERSIEGKTYEVIGQVKGNNSETGGTYSFADNKPLNGKNFYRLKLVDVDNKFEYSKVITLENSNNNTFVITAYPNPTENNLQVSVAGVRGNNAKITITDISGKSVLDRAINADVTSLDIGSLSSGFYFLKYTDDLNTQTIKFSKK